ncbi:MAG TPA: PhzF family phenazine biosynthesis protein [Thermoanaerobaculia bacterium]|nr:PhzF family phenazine biosynthesis protein [Thermoanaerobaculia bacterium]
MKVSFVTCDVFTRRPFTGNPLFVVPNASGLTTAQMQALAREINYSESTFVIPAKDPRHGYLQRTFVPVKEIPYAGHPTVGTAVVMASLGKIGGENGGDVVPVTIEVGFGPLKLELEKSDGTVTRVRMEQGRPAWDEPLTSQELLGKIASGLDVPYDALFGPHPPRVVSTGNRFLMLPIPSLDFLSKAEVDPRILSLVERELDVLGIYLFTRTGDESVRARAFCPSAGVPEDPATGSAAGPLGVYLAVEKALPASRRFRIDQGIEMGRPSEIDVEVLLDGERPAGVRVSGSAVVMMRGEIDV